MMQLPSNYKLIYKKSEIAEAVQKLGTEIGTWAKNLNSSQDIIAIPVLRGGVFFYADLVRNIDISLEMAPVRTWAYRGSGMEAKVKQNIDIHFESLNPAGRHILLVDDICDSGGTLRTLTGYFTTVGAASVKSAVLIKRDLGKESFKPDYVAFFYQSKEWFVGYGMEDDERYRNLPDIYVIEGSGSHVAS